MYRYYLPLRPVMPGTVPKNFDNFKNFDYRMYNDDAGHKVWGYVEYNEPLTKSQIDEYELIPSKEN